MCTAGNRDGQPALVIVYFGKAEGELSRKGRSLGHALLAESLENPKVRYFALRPMGKFLIGVAP